MKKSKKIIINFSGVTESEALYYVQQVVQDGRVSNGKHGKHYCWATRFTLSDGKEVMVFVNEKRKTTKDLDGFFVSKK